VKGNPADSSLTVEMLDRRRWFCIQSQSQSRQGQTDQRRLLCQEEGLKRRGHVPECVDVQKAAAFPGRYRILYFLAQALLWVVAVYVEIV